MHQPRNAIPSAHSPSHRTAHSRREVLRLFGRTASAVAFLALLEPVATARPAAAATSASDRRRVRALLARLTLDEKISWSTGPPTPNGSARPDTCPACPVSAYRS
ncbi:hypothetical protein [Streptomyces sp. NPDC002845]